MPWDWDGFFFVGVSGSNFGWHPKNTRKPREDGFRQTERICALIFGQREVDLAARWAPTSYKVVVGPL